MQPKAKQEAGARMQRWMEAVSSAGAVAAGALMAFYFAGPALGSGPVTPLAVETRALPLSSADAEVDRVGRLKFLGAVQLVAKDARFGGLSAMLWEPGCNRLLAVSDAGTWFVLEPKERDGRLEGIANAWIAPVLAPDGRPPISKRAADAEALARLADGSSWVFYEQDHRGERFAAISACRPDSLAQAADRVWVPPMSANWPENGGLEAVAGSGSELRIALEAVPGPDGGKLGLVGRPDGVLSRFSWMAPEGHQPTAMEPLEADGSRVLVLHRKFSPLEGVSAILTEAEIPTGAEGRVVPKEIARLRAPVLVDNMEALAVRREGERRFVYLASDDNFNPLQRTLLMKFELLPDQPAAR
jgi:hypothetical protein